MKLFIILKEMEGELISAFVKRKKNTQIVNFKLMTDILLWIHNAHKFELFCSKHLNSFSII